MPDREKHSVLWETRGCPVPPIINPQRLQRPLEEISDSLQPARCGVHDSPYTSAMPTGFPSFQALSLVLPHPPGLCSLREVTLAKTAPNPPLIPLMVSMAPVPNMNVSGLRLVMTELLAHGLGPGTQLVFYRHHM